MSITHINLYSSNKVFDVKTTFLTTRRVMYEDWREVQEFPTYSISNRGTVVTEAGRPLVQQLQQYGVPNVWFVRGSKQFCRSVPLLVARAFLLPPEREDFISPIQLDGDRANCCADNLMWRPRWFSICFHKERATPPFPDWNGHRVQIRETGEIFPNPLEVSKKYGVLETEVYLATQNGNSVFPQRFHYQLI